MTYYHHFKYEIFNVVYDQIIVEMNNHFAERSTNLLRCNACLDPRNSFAHYDTSKILELAGIIKMTSPHMKFYTLEIKLTYSLVK